jgi:YD repeat-containing protein
VTKHAYYDWFGNIIKADTNSCLSTSWVFSGTTQYAYPNSVVCGTGSPTLTQNFAYNAYTGQLYTSTDPNSQQSVYQYADPLKRLTSAERSDGVTRTIAYNDSSNATTITTPITASSSAKTVAAADGLGRVIKTTTEDAAGTSYSIVEQQYDPVGRAYKTSNPHNSTAQYWTEIDFDALGRPTKATAPAPDSSVTNYTYATNTLTVSDPAGKARKFQNDGTGRLAAVYEPDVTNGNALTIKTSYSYTVLDFLIGVAQGVQTRTFGFDNLGRLTTVKDPETNSVAYQYQYNDFDLLTQRTDPRGVITTYGYDTLNRLHQISYNVGSTGVPSPGTVTYNYGTNAAQNNNGRLTSMTDGSGSESYTYDTIGRVTQLQKMVGSTTYPVGYGYDYANQITSITYPSGRTVQQNPDAIGRLNSVVGTLNSVQTTYASGFSYGPASQPTGFEYGNGFFASYGFSPDRLQLTCLDYSKTNRSGTCTHDSGTRFGLTYSYGTAGSKRRVDRSDH